MGTMLLHPVLQMREPQLPVHRLLLLSPREREVLELVATGASNKRIGEILFLSPKTVESHMRRIRTKLGLSNGPDVNLRAVACATYWSARAAVAEDHQRRAA